MKKKDVQIGKRYRANVSGKRVSVRIDRETPLGGWFATNLATGRTIRIKTAARLSPSVEDMIAAAEARRDARVCDRIAEDATNLVEYRTESDRTGDHFEVVAVVSGRRLGSIDLGRGVRVDDDGIDVELPAYAYVEGSDEPVVVAYTRLAPPAGTHDPATVLDARDLTTLELIETLAARVARLTA